MQVTTLNSIFWLVGRGTILAVVNLLCVLLPAAESPPSPEANGGSTNLLV